MRFLFSVILLSSFFCRVLTAGPSVLNAAENTAAVKETLAALEKSMDPVETIQASFIQKKKMKMFNHEVIMTGLFYMQRPDWFAWHTQTPFEYSVVFKDDTVFQWSKDSGRTESTGVKDQPVLKTVFEQIRTWIQGNYAVLQDEYDVTVLSENPIILDFKPYSRSAYFDRIEHLTIQINPDRKAVDMIEINEKSGAVTSFYFKDIKLNEKIAPEAWKAGGHARQ